MKSVHLVRTSRDLRMYGNIQRFQVEILAAGLTSLQLASLQTDDTGEHYINIFKASGPAGYNNLPGCPGRSRLFWWRVRQWHSPNRASNENGGRL